MKSFLAWTCTLLLLAGCGPDTVQVDYTEHDISTLQELMQSGDLSSEQLTAYYLRRIEAVDRAGPELNSIIELNPDAITIAKVLAAAAKSEEADLIICGQQSDDLSYNAVGPALAQFLDMRHVQIVLEMEPLADGRLKVSHELDNNLIETVDVQLPAVVGVQSGINDVRYASLKGIMQAGSKPQQKLGLADLGLSADDVAPKVRIEKVGFPVRTSQAEILEGDAKEVANQLVHKLINDAKVL